MPAQRKNLVGSQFGWLVAVSHAGFNERRQSLWRCRCRCSREIVCDSDALTRGEKRSCPERATEFRLRAVFVTTIGPNGATTRFGK